MLIYISLCNIYGLLWENSFFSRKPVLCSNNIKLPGLLEIRVEIVNEIVIKNNNR